MLHSNIFRLHLVKEARVDRVMVLLRQKGYKPKRKRRRERESERERKRERTRKKLPWKVLNICTEHCCTIKCTKQSDVAWHLNENLLYILLDHVFDSKISSYSTFPCSQFVIDTISRMRQKNIFKVHRVKEAWVALDIVLLRQKGYEPKRERER
jgi:hypothetical protein